MKKLHPLTGLVFAVVCGIVALTRSQGAVSLGIFVTEMAAAAGLGIFLPYLRTVLRTLGPLVLSAGLMALIFTAPEGWGWHLGSWTLSQSQVDAALNLAGRVGAGFGGMVLLFLTTPPSDLALGLEQKGLPSPAAYLLAASYNLVPGMAGRVHRVQDALRTRGANFEASLWSRLLNLCSIAIPVIVCELLAAEQRAAVLMVRGFATPGKKTAWRQLPDAPWEPPARTLMLLAGLVEMARPALIGLGWW